MSVHARKAREALSAAELLFAEGYLSDCASRLYYVYFHAAQAALASADITPRTHRGLRRAFAEHLVLPGTVPQTHMQWFTEAEQLRTLADYDPESTVNEVHLRELLDHAVVFLETLLPA